LFSHYRLELEEKSRIIQTFFPLFHQNLFLFSN
jgi:hypothetical protein